jgi:flagellar biosynthesis/type III secretory pathway chaperone
MDVKLLEETLSNQLQLFEKLYMLLEQETDELARMNLEVIAVMNRQKDELTGCIEINNNSLRRIISTIASELGLAPGATLGAVALAIGKKGDLLRLRHKLAAAAQRVQETAAVNCKISERFARTAGITLGFLGRLINRSSVYGASGGYLQRSSVSVMINREV